MICEVKNVHEAVIRDNGVVHSVARLVTARLPPGPVSYATQQAAGRDLIAFLARYTLGAEANACTVRKLASGRPILINGSAPVEGVTVSLSHSHCWVAAALARDGAIGIDIEQEKPRRRIAAMADWMGWPDCDGATDFYRAWTFREALLKCRGGEPPATGSEPFPRESETDPARRHVLYWAVAPAVHACVVLEMARPCRLSWSLVDAGRLVTW